MSRGKIATFFFGLFAVGVIGLGLGRAILVSLGLLAYAIAYVCLEDWINRS